MPPGRRIVHPGGASIVSPVATRLENHRITRAILRRLPLPVRKLVFRGWARHCPVCGNSVWRFLTFGGSDRPNALCPICESQERHRLNWVYLRRHTNLFDGSPRRLLHVAPEANLEERFRRVSNVDYVSADLVASRAMVQMDLMDIDFPEDWFDVIFCSHVLEHVADDRRAMRELRRVLKPGGWALLPIPPIRIEKTTEDPGVTDPEERRRRFGQHDHVRRYGRDYVDRLREAGFRVTAASASEVVGADQVERLGVGNGDAIFLCEKTS
jgi:predicted SAM-dependent methyltransferase